MRVVIGPYPKNPTKDRKIDIRIDKHDTWDMFHTLAMITLPMLKQLKETKHGIPNPCFAGRHGHETPQYSFKFIDPDEDFKRGVEKWDEILDKMIWSFEQILSDGEWESQFFHYDGEPRHWFEPVEGSTHKLMMSNLKWFDRHGYIAYAERIQEGLDLFGKYYQSLWD